MPFRWVLGEATAKSGVVVRGVSHSVNAPRTPVGVPAGTCACACGVPRVPARARLEAPRARVRPCVHARYLPARCVRPVLPTCGRAAGVPAGVPAGTAGPGISGGYLGRLAYCTLGTCLLHPRSFHPRHCTCLPCLLAVPPRLAYYALASLPCTRPVVPCGLPLGFHPCTSLGDSIPSLCAASRRARGAPVGLMAYTSAPRLGSRPAPAPAPRRFLR